IGDDKYEVGEENVFYKISSLSGVDAFIRGHSQAEFPGTSEKPSFYANYSGDDAPNAEINISPVTIEVTYDEQHEDILLLKVS
ncbi:2',3'-cyclic-nucleotide 2'-phosphodiesterase, partial [Streptococcus suis]